MPTYDPLKPIQAKAHDLYNAWVALEALAGTEMAVEILTFLKPLPPPSAEFITMMEKWGDKMRLLECANSRVVADIAREMREAAARGELIGPGKVDYWASRLEAKE